MIFSTPFGRSGDMAAIYEIVTFGEVRIGAYGIDEAVEAAER